MVDRSLSVKSLNLSEEETKDKMKIDRQLTLKLKKAILVADKITGV